MSCWKPRKVARLFATDKKGNRKILWSIPDNFPTSMYECIFVPCGQCGGCRVEYSRQWAIRCMHEARLYERNCFITLTFDDVNLFKRDNPYSLDKRDFPDFIKRLRDRENHGLLKDDPMFKRIRYFHCGEYGDKNGRPHYHSLLFNYDFADKKFLTNRRGNKLYTSKLLSELWPYGYASIGELTFESAAYVARYCTKKFNNKDKEKVRAHYEYVDEDGVVYDCIPEYSTMSRDGGIGKDYAIEHMKFWYPQDAINLGNGIKCKPPKYYDSLFEVINPKCMAVIKRRRSDVYEDVDSSDYVRECEAMAANMKAKFALFCKRDL